MVVFFDFPCVFAYFANNPSHWDGNPGIGIVNPYNPKQSQPQAEAWVGPTERDALMPSKFMICTVEQQGFLKNCVLLPAQLRAEHTNQSEGFARTA